VGGRVSSSAVLADSLEYVFPHDSDGNSTRTYGGQVATALARIFNLRQVAGGLGAPSGGDVGDASNVGGGGGGGVGGAGGGVSRRQAALSLVRQMEGFESLEAILTERQRYLKGMEAKVGVCIIACACQHFVFSPLRSLSPYFSSIFERKQETPPA